MKTRLLAFALALAIGGLTLSAGAFAQDKAKDAKKDPTVREIAVKEPGVQFVQDHQILSITSAAELGKMLPIELQKGLKKEVDFTTQQLILFAWSGRSDDKLTYTASANEVIFRYEAGRVRTKRNPDAKPVPERDARDEPGEKNRQSQQVRAFTIPKGIAWHTQGWPYVPDPFTIPKKASSGPGKCVRPALSYSEIPELSYTPACWKPWTLSESVPLVQK